MRKVLYLLGGLLAALLSVSASAEDNRTFPRVDDRVAIGVIAEDRVQVTAPYLFHESNHRADLNTLAEWACQLYKRNAVWVSFDVSDPVCDTLGMAAAKRDPSCGHTYLYACAIP